MILILLGCDLTPSAVTMSGIAWDAPNGEGSPLGGATLDIQDIAYAVVDSVVTESDGSFLAEVPAGEPFFATLSAEGAVPTNFSGAAGLTDFGAPEGFPWVATDAFMADIRTEFAGCPGVDEAGSVIWGEIVVDGIGYPVMSLGEARLQAADGTEVTACYLDEEGVYDPEATAVGTLGRFAIFGVPAGEIVMDIRYTDMYGEQPVEFYRFLSPTDGLVPMYPALIAI
jgi:hypothetical protein